MFSGRGEGRVVEDLRPGGYTCEEVWEAKMESLRSLPSQGENGVEKQEVEVEDE